MAFRTEKHDDLSLFKNRLLDLMLKNGYLSARQLAKALYLKDLVNVNSKQSDDAFYNDDDIEKNAIGSIQKKIERHLHADTMEKIQGEYIAAYCRLFNCSADYLFGFTEIQSGNPDIRNACQITGLSEQAVVQLSDALVDEEETSPVHRLWSQLLESDLFYGLLHDWSSAYQKAEECIQCEAASAAIAEVLKTADPSSTSYHLVAIKEKPIDKAGKEHYAAYYGVLHKVGQDVTALLDALVEKTTDENSVYVKEFEQRKRQYRLELGIDTGDASSTELDNEFKWNSHIVF